MKKVYVGMSADILHKGHLNILTLAKEKGRVIVGLLTDEAISKYKNPPVLSYSERKEMLSSIILVDEIIEQQTLDYVSNLRKVKPDFVVHGNDWKEGAQKETRRRVIEALSEWGGELIEPEYTPGISSTLIKEAIEDSYRVGSKGTTPTRRLRQLKRLISNKDIVRVLEAHNGLTGLIVEKTKSGNEEFDAIWVSSLTDSTAKGKPDTELVNFESRFNTIEQIIEVTTKPIIVDADTGGLTEHFKYHVKTLERLGVSAVIIEDKIGPKRNSLFGNEVPQQQSDIDEFCEKIRAGKSATVTKDFMIIARIESLILEKGVDDAISRAKSYISSGADGIMIHCKDKDPHELFSFCDRYKDFEKKVPLVAVPSSYPQITEKELHDIGINIVIYANHLLRSAYPAMVNVAKSILNNGSSEDASKNHCMSVSEILRLIPEDY
jgi:phosphoenolpyruvate phosphomutase